MLVQAHKIVWSSILDKIITKKVQFFSLQVSQFFQNSWIIYRHLLAVFLMFFSYWLNEAYTTHVGPSDRSLFLHKAPSVKSRSHSPRYFIKKTLPKSISSVISAVVLTDTCVFCFSILVSVDPQNCSLVWYISERAVAHKLFLHSWRLYFVLVSSFSAEHTQHQILLHSCQVCLVGSWMELVFLVLRSKR